ncbi:MAG: hypothetical protein LQ346_006747 [Caloplaca aetnensis]|nr:MAG: hypothetical protein LQ346_006747 [Caloplaca aetnensis]
MNTEGAHGDAIAAQSELTDKDLHGLSADDWCPGGCYDAAVTIRAAENPDPNILRTILEHGDQQHPNGHAAFPGYLDQDYEYGPNAVNSPDLPGYTSALLQAIISQHPQNVTTLLNAGADPNGFSLPLLSQNAAGFLRLGPHFAERQDYRMEDLSVFNREYLLTYIPVPQLSSLTPGEVKQRFECPLPSNFWSEVNFRTLCPVENADSIPALVAAAEKPDLTILQSLLDAPGTDTSFWTLQPQPRDIPSPATPSSLAIASPLHAAIRGRNLPALSLLLSQGFNPNVLPLAAPTRCITPAMATIVCCDPWNADAYNTLRQHSLLDLGIRTPVYNVSLLHFAVARLDLQALKTIAADVPLSSAGRTALGHSLLHVACLPLDESWVQMHSEPIFKSCRETRNLSEMDIAAEGPGDYVQARRVWQERHQNFYDFNLHFRGPGKKSKRPSRFSARPTAEAVRDCHRRQVDVVRYLLENCKTIDVTATDVHGNTTLHYLASHRNVNEELLDLLWDGDDAEEAGRESKNQHGFTAAELFDSGHNVVEEDKGFWTVVGEWEEKKSQEKEIWEGKFRAGSEAVVQRALLGPERL